MAKPIRAWTGGTPPNPIAGVSAEELFTIGLLYFEQCRVFRDYWREAPDAETARTFWNRARHDAHATHRGPA